MAFFYEICDYLDSNIIGTGTTEVGCLFWDNMKLTATETKDAFYSALNNYIKSATKCTSDEPCNDIYEEKIYTDFWQGCYLDYMTLFFQFWNMMICEPLTGVQTESVLVPLLVGGTTTVDITVDYGDGTFDTNIVEEYEAMSAQFMCCIQNVMTLVMGETFEQSEMPNFDPVTYP